MSLFEKQNSLWFFVSFFCQQRCISEVIRVHQTTTALFKEAHCGESHLINLFKQTLEIPLIQ